MNARLFAVPVLALTLLGAGCAPTVSPTPQTPPVSVPGTSPDTAEFGEDFEERVLAPAQTDDTWKTYMNAGLGFSFLTPTKGRYAPQWEVKVFSKNTTALQGCYAATGASLDAVQVGITPDGRKFCISHGTEGAAGSAYFSDTYGTRIGNSVVVIIFTKKAIMADIGDCVRAPGQKFWSEFAKPGACIPFSEEEYQKTLDGIMGTFKTK